MNTPASEVYEFLKSFSGCYVSLEDVCRGMRKEQRDVRDRHQTLPLLQRLEMDGLVERNAQGEYRARTLGTTAFRDALQTRHFALGETTIIEYAKSSEASDPLLGPKREEQLRELNRILGVVQRTKNEIGLRRLIAEDYRGISARGAIHSKEDTIARFTSPELILHAVTSEEVSVRIFGLAGVVTGRALAEGTVSGHDFRSRVRFTDIWALRQGSWELVASQATPEEPRSDNTFHSFLRRGA